MKKKYSLRRIHALVMTMVVFLGSFAMSAAAASVDGKFYTDFAKSEEEQAAAEKLAAQIGSEGMVLLKNRDNARPFSESIQNMTLFGGGAYFPVFGGGGFGAARISA